MLRNKTRLIAVFIMSLVCAVVGSKMVNAKILLNDPELLEHSMNDIFLVSPCLTGASSSLGGDITISGSTAEEKLWSGLTSFLDDVQAAGVMGNIGQEDGNYNPVRREVGQSGNLYDRNAQMGLGFVQWSFGRRVNLLSYIKERDASLIQYFEDDSLAQISGDDFISKVGEDDANKIFQLEIEFMKSEIDKSYKEYYNKTDIDDATVWFRANYERAGVYSDDFRKEKAHEAYNKFAGATFEATSIGMSGSGDSPCNACAEGSLNINGAGACLAWPLGTDEDKYKLHGGSGTELFTSFWEKDDKVYKKGSDIHQNGAYCCGFTAAVVHFSGYDPNFKSTCDHNDYENKSGQIGYAMKHPDLWEILDYNKDSLMGGDIIYENRSSSVHYYMIVQDENGDFYRAEASNRGENSLYGRIEKFSNPSGDARIIRATKAKNSNVGVSVTDGVKTSSITGTIANSGKLNNGSIGASAVELAWPYSDFTGEMNYKKKANDKFTSFYETLSGRDGDANGKGGKSCDYFLHTVLVYAGLENNDSFPWGNVGNVNDYLEQSDNWEEVNMANNRKLDEYKDGDVIIYFKGGNAAHVAILVEVDGKKYTAQASYGEYYGVVKGTGNITGELNPGDDNFDSVRVFRNKRNNNGGNNSCNVCDDGGGDLQLKAGGMNLSEAKEFMKAYHDAAGQYGYGYGNVIFQGALVTDAGCVNGPLNNCVAFSQWFINRFTTLGPNWSHTANGVNLVDNLVKDGLKSGNEPRPYAIFSHSGPTESGHTGVVLGVDEDAKKIIIGEASCSGNNPSAREVSFDDAKGWKYAYTDDVISMGGELKSV